MALDRLGLFVGVHDGSAVRDPWTQSLMCSGTA